MATTKLTRAFGAGNRRTWTLSLWVKRSSLSGVQCIMAQQDGWQGNGNAGIYFESGKISTYNFGDSLNSGNSSKVGTKREFRDTNACYHLVFRQDTTQGTASNRFRIYVNGVQETDLLYTNYSSQNVEPNFNRSTRQHGIGGHQTDNSYQFDGSMSHVHFCDGYSYDASSFGETDTTTGEWKAKTSPSVNYGTTGFLILKDGNTITDQSSNSNNFTLGGGTLTDLKDNPDNNFATLNPLAKGVNVTLTNCNLQFTSNNRYGTVGTLGVSSGKWYWEVKAVDVGSDIQVGIFQDGGNIGHPNQELGGTSQGWSVISIGGNKFNNSSQASYGSAFSDGDILMVALDMDNGKWYMGKNNSWFDSGNPATSSSPAHTGITGTIFPSIATYAESESGSINYQFNFGNGIFGTTAITTNSGNGYSGAEGSSKFNYQPPTGYSALNTKGLNE
jgi:hypothetical protein